jgi:hypothetical protein
VLESPRRTGGDTTQISIKLTAEELELLIGLATDQLFRREFIEPKLPGHKPDSGQLGMAKNLVARLRSLLNPGPAARVAAESPGRRRG